jgi:hypothetical protein
MRWALLLVALGACGRLGFEARVGGGDDVPRDSGGTDGIGGTDGGVDAATDAALIDAVVTLCFDPGNGCTFPGAVPCSCFGTSMIVSAVMAEGGGALRITPNANTLGAQGSCIRNATPFGMGGAIIEISQVVTGAQGLTAIQLGGGSDVHQLAVQGGQLIAQDGTGTIATMAYNGAAMRWWRIRPTGATTLYEYSSSGVTWTPLVTSTLPGSATYDVRIIAGTLGAINAPGFAQIESVNLCP